MSVVFEKIKTLKPSQIFLKKREDNNFLVVSNLSQEIFYLNGIAREFYENCNANETILTIFEKLFEEYEVEKEVLESDLVELIRDFQWKNLLELQELV